MRNTERNRVIRQELYELFERLSSGQAPLDLETRVLVDQVVSGWLIRRACLVAAPGLVASVRSPISHFRCSLFRGQPLSHDRDGPITDRNVEATRAYAGRGGSLPALAVRPAAQKSSCCVFPNISGVGLAVSGMKLSVPLLPELEERLAMLAERTQARSGTTGRTSPTSHATIA